LLPVGEGRGFVADFARQCLLVEDQAANRDWLVAALRHAFGDVTIHTARTLKEADAWLDAGGRQGLWLALIDLGLPDGSGTQLIRRLRDEAPDAMLVVATIYDDDQHLFDALAAGVHGYLLKDQDVDAMTSLLQRVEHGEPPLSPSIARRLLRHFAVPGTSAPGAGEDETTLTGRETETLTLLARGLTINEVARALGLKPQTVAGYVKVIYQKLNVSTRAEATLKAVKRGLA
jgi:DNA-binding NarL/FixJ family response regulator